MTEKEFFRSVTNAKTDVLELFLNALSELSVDYCVIGGLAVNAYAEPVVSLDLDVVVTASELDQLCQFVTENFAISHHPHRINLNSPESDLRIQLQTDPNYQEFISTAATMKVLGYEMRVAAPEEVLKGKLWAYEDKERRASKRQKDLADIMRLVEARPNLAELLPEDLRALMS